MQRLRSASPYLLAALLGGAGATHLLHPAPYDAIVPHVLPHPRAWTVLSGLVELGLAAATAWRPTRRQGALAAAGLFVVVFPANVQMALDAHGTAARLVAYGRLPLQLPLVLWAWQVAQSSRACGKAREPV